MIIKELWRDLTFFIFDSDRKVKSTVYKSILEPSEDFERIYGATAVRTFLQERYFYYVFLAKSCAYYNRIVFLKRSIIVILYFLF